MRFRHWFQRLNVVVPVCGLDALTVAESEVEQLAINEASQRMREHGLRPGRPKLVRVDDLGDWRFDLKFVVRAYPTRAALIGGVR